MATPDMDVIKEIPGYKVILKAVLKSQIQQLVEQLASYTEEESVILTASISDGTLSHLGSDSGKFFLEDHEDVKSQFLGFCLKRHHRKKQEEEQKEREEREEREREEAMRVAAMQSRARMGYMHRSPRLQSPRQPYMRGAPGFSPRGSVRQEPYHIARPKRTSLSFDVQGNNANSVVNNPGMNNPAVAVKLEPEDDNTNSGDQNAGLSSQNTNQTTPSKVKPDLDNDDKASNASSSATLLLDTNDSYSNTAGGDNLNQDNQDNQEQGESDSAGVTNVKLEAISELDMELELEITGVEPGRPMVPQQESWNPASTSGGFDQSGAMGSPGDMQGYNNQSGNLLVATPRNQQTNMRTLHVCQYCGKTFFFKSKLTQHVKSHTGEKDFVCGICGQAYNRRDRLRNHMITCHKVLPSSEEIEK